MQRPLLPVRTRKCTSTFSPHTATSISAAFKPRRRYPKLLDINDEGVVIARPLRLPKGTPSPAPLLMSATSHPSPAREKANQSPLTCPQPLFPLRTYRKKAKVLQRVQKDLLPPKVDCLKVSLLRNADPLPAIVAATTERTNVTTLLHGRETKQDSSSSSRSISIAALCDLSSASEDDFAKPKSQVVDSGVLQYMEVKHLLCTSTKSKQGSENSGQVEMRNFFTKSWIEDRQAPCRR